MQVSSQLALGVRFDCNKEFPLCKMLPDPCLVCLFIGNIMAQNWPVKEDTLVSMLNSYLDLLDLGKVFQFNWCLKQILCIQTFPAGTLPVRHETTPNDEGDCHLIFIAMMSMANTGLALTTTS